MISRVSSIFVFVGATLAILSVWRLFLNQRPTFTQDKTGPGPIRGNAQLPEMLSFRKEFSAFMQKFDRAYHTAADKRFRFGVFVQNLEYIRAHNKQGHSFKLGVNNHTDRTPEEMKSLVKGFHLDKHAPKNIAHNLSLSDMADFEPIDWQSKGCVTEIKNQKSCGSCWAFSTTGSIEGRVCAAGRPLVSLSEQQLVDCAGKEGGHGCQGGLMDQGFQYVMDNHGICTEDAYPYIARRHWLAGCQAKKCTNAGQITGFSDVPAGDEKALYAALVEGTVSVAIDAGTRDFMLYHSGVYDGSCKEDLDHGVLLVGAGTDEATGLKFWRVKNSWGASWGEKGYIRIRAMNGAKGKCGIAIAASYPIV